MKAPSNFTTSDFVFFVILGIAILSEFFIFQTKGRAIWFMADPLRNSQEMTAWIFSAAQITPRLR